MRAPRRKTIAGALFAALFLAAIALAGNNLSGTSTQSAALNVSHMLRAGITIRQLDRIDQGNAGGPGEGGRTPRA